MRWIIALAWIVAATTSSAQGVPSSRSGGLVPAPTPGLSRDELVRSWDIDKDGTISKSEADLARARMKRERLELQLGTSPDPVTGLPRVEPGATEPTDDPRGPRYQLPPELPHEHSSAANEKAGGQAPPSVRPKSMAELAAPIGPGSSAASASGGTSSAASSTPTKSAERSGRASWLPPVTTGSTGVGGPRAGAPAAVPGYGATAFSDLNAGRLRAMQRDAEKATVPRMGRSTVSGGGLLPMTREPGRTGALFLPGQTTPKLAPIAPLAPVAPTVPTYAPPRITAEDIGGYRP